MVDDKKKRKNVIKFIKSVKKDKNKIIKKIEQKSESGIKKFVNSLFSFIKGDELIMGEKTLSKKEVEQMLKSGDLTKLGFSKEYVKVNDKLVERLKNRNLTLRDGLNLFVTEFKNFLIKTSFKEKIKTLSFVFILFTIVVFLNTYSLILISKLVHDQKLATILTACLMGPIFEEMAKYISSNRKAGFIYNLVFNMGEMSSYVLKIIAGGGSLLYAVVIRSFAVIMHTINQIRMKIGSVYGKMGDSKEMYNILMVNTFYHIMWNVTFTYLDLLKIKIAGLSYKATTVLTGIVSSVTMFFDKLYKFFINFIRDIRKGLSLGEKEKLIRLIKKYSV